MLAATAALALVGAVRAEELSISSNVASFGSPNLNQFTFDFDTPVGNNLQIQAIEVRWNVSLPNGATFPDPQPSNPLVLSGDLSFGLTNGGVGFLLTVPTTGGNASIVVEKRPIPQSANDALLSDLFDDSNNVINAGFVAGGDFASFFQANPTGSITAKMTLYYTSDRGQGGEVPEPASMLMWGAAGVGLLVRRRFMKKA
jgi:hypothetical protein